MADIPFEGFKYDQGRAEAMADAVSAVFTQARKFDVTVPDQLAALAIVAADLILASGLRRSVHATAQRIADYIEAVAASRAEQEGSPRP